MSGADDFFGPYQYPLWVLWLVLGLVGLALVVAWYVFVFRFSARRLPPAQRAALAASRPADLADTKAKYLALIDEVETAATAGRLNDRGVHSRLSLLLRFFAHETNGVDTHVMTLADLRESNLPRLAGAVEQYYPPAFRLEEPGDTARAVATARDLVSSWG
ncbi:hypothetical protein ITJ55_03095 [Frigoribacterium sp. VKM Ac-1396]|uniref:hypothetical protein n=1 Tax=Frigoribacterium sp. VKM Ac-1396 TaxID=2783821 RepID=UPI00188A461A|nr:hypothetical protein [Frigoribacterium sp. VKM Ac-1396]MBF4599788.1 hypothetical protein [Frigoribacterium sp. VKM Ac-1396]